ncbi:uncharacterized protein MICPUCDRAFT_58233 [Micromonas pusilla CCMP1545]|uniref:Predicted protein n=1 Tax=Micromonas pusilla (strain CCMP1545) TaxID=564608 RepID=C1MRU3_MICPC|nr:uncharacterized protein MICPUCDRAFT_58233 [Micromonas pusilla CCMP1545]EEH57388.1 predicted protein [Micromonas pusilla CCMP1545]|eukprot:XP_003058933.1 predicted protein [Micromonas pusilla CCMP1545]
MKGTNPETQGHRWAKRVKKRQKREQIEEGQWADLERKKIEEDERARLEAEEDAAFPSCEPSPSEKEEEEDDDDDDDGAATGLRDEEGLDAEELAAVRAVKVAAAAAAERLRRVSEEGEETRARKKARAGERPRSTTKPARVGGGGGANPFAALAFRPAPAPAKPRARENDPRARPPPPEVPAPRAHLQKHRRGPEASVNKSRRLGVVGRTGLSAKAQKKALKRRRKEKERTP